MRRSYFIIGLCLLISIGVRAQVHSGGITMGYTIPNDSERKYVGVATYGIEYSYSKQMVGNEFWKEFWGYPSFGLRASWAGSPEGIAGSRFGLNGYVQAPIIQNLDWTLGLGFSAYTKPYSITNDPKNICIGSIINCLIDLGIVYKVPIEHKGTADVSLRFVHSSNGYLKKPNHGLNFVQLGLGYSINPRGGNNYRIYEKEHLNTTQYSKNNLFISLAPGIVQTRRTDLDKYYYTYTTQVGYMRRFHPCMAYGANLDIMQNGSHPAWLKAKHEHYPLPFYLGICANFEAYMGDLSVRVSLGTNLTYSSLVSLPIYEHVGAFYHFGKRLQQYAGVSLKAYAAHIDYIEWTYGINLPLGKS